MKKLRLAAIAVVAVAVSIQWIPVDRGSPSAAAPLDAPAEIAAILRTSCYDCHSSETVWPWYSRVAPVSWLVARDVREGREHLDFSNWGALDEKRRAHALKEIAEVTAEGEMPLAAYKFMHRGATLTAGQVAALRAWTAANRRSRPCPGSRGSDIRSSRSRPATSPCSSTLS